MSTEELFDELRKLKRADKLRAMQALLMELATEENVLPTNPPLIQWATAQPKESPPHVKSWQDYVDPVDDRDCTGERAAQIISKYLYSKERDELTTLLDRGIKFPVYREYLAFMQGFIEELAYLYHGQSQFRFAPEEKRIVKARS